MQISDRLARLKPPAIRVIAERAGELAANGVDVVSMSAGEPDFTTPQAIIDAASAAATRGETHYSPAAGIKPLREGVAQYYRTRFGLEFAPEQVIIGNGAKPLLYETLAALVNPGDEVIVIAPAWVSYIEQIRLCEGTPVVVETTQSAHDLDLDAIRAAITERTVALILNAPNNPTGKIYSDDRVVDLCRLSIEHGFTIINDEVYERITFGGRAYRNPLCLCPDAAEHLVSINSVSKSFAMTGWRVGYALAPLPLIKKITALQGHIISGAPSPAQWAALAAIKNGDDDVTRMCDAYEDRLALVSQALTAMPLVRYTPPDGTFYAFVDIRDVIGRTVRGEEITDDVGFCEALLEVEQVAIVPGTAFLAPGFVRLSFATGHERLEAGLSRLHRFLAQIPER